LYELNFRKKVVQEDATIENKGYGGIKFGKRLGYLFILKLTTHICAIRKNIEMPRLLIGVKRLELLN